jgi:hypothetical protein
VPHVRIKRLGTGDGQHHRAQREKCAQPVTQEEAERIERVQRVKDDHRVGGDVHDPQHRDDPKVGEHDRAEEDTDASCAMRLDREQPDEDEHGDRHDERRKMWRDRLQSLDGRKD